MTHHAMETDDAFRVDIRAKLLVVVAAGLASLLTRGAAAATLPAVVGLPLLLRLRQWRIAALLAGCLPLLWLSCQALARQGSMAGGLAAYLCYTLLRLAPLAALLAAVGATSRLGDLLGALTLARLPRELVVALAVTFRFAPTLWGEYACIREAMAVRGVRTGLHGLFTQPLRQVEYVLLPFMVRATRLADELSASAMTRGLEAPDSLRRTLPPLGVTDWLLLAWAVAGLAALAGEFVWRAGE